MLRVSFLMISLNPFLQSGKEVKVWSFHWPGTIWVGPKCSKDSFKGIKILEKNIIRAATINILAHPKGWGKKEVKFKK